MTTPREHFKQAFFPVKETPVLTVAEEVEAQKATKQGLTPAEGALSAIDSAWYTRLIGLPDAARMQAQNTYAIASAVAAGLLGAALLVKLDAQPTWVRIVGIGGIGVWAFACLAYVWTVGSPLFRSPPDVEDKNVYVATVAKATRTEREQVYSRVWFANKVSIVAIVLTLIALGGAVLHGPEQKQATVFVTQVEVGVISVTCSRFTPFVQGMVQVSTITSQEVLIAPTDCGNVKELVIPSSAITAIRQP